MSLLCFYQTRYGLRFIRSVQIHTFIGVTTATKNDDWKFEIMNSRRPTPIPTTSFKNGVECCILCDTTASSKWYRSDKHGVLVCRVCADTGVYGEHYGDKELVRVASEKSRPL